MASSRIPLAVGFTIELSSEIVDILKNLIPDEENFPSPIHVPVWFSVRPTSWGGEKLPPGITKENCKSSSNVQQWYRRKMEKGPEFKIYLKSLYVSKKKTLVAAVMNCDGELCYAIFYNKNDIPTSIIKKTIGSGNLSAQNLENVDLSSYDRITLVGKPYIYYA